MEDKVKREELSRTADVHQIGSTWIQFVVAFISIVVVVVAPHFSDEWETVLLQVVLIFIAIVIFWMIYQKRMHGVNTIKAVQELKYLLAVYVLVVLVDIVFLTGWSTKLQDWFMTSIELPYSIIVIVGIGIVLLGTKLYLSGRTTRTSERSGIFSEAAVAEFMRLNQVTLDQDLMWQQKIKETESQNEERVKKVESARDTYRDWWLRISQGTLQVLGLPETQIEAYKADPLILAEYSLRTIRYLQENSVRKVVYYDPNYRSSFVTNLEKARDYFADRGFVVKNASELRKWMREAIDNEKADKCIAVFIQDIIPDTVAEELDKSCTFRQFLEKGGRVVWRGDVPCFYLGKVDKVLGRWDVKGAEEILGVSYMNLQISDPNSSTGRLWDSNFPVSITDAGKEIGITEAMPPRRPVPRQDVTTVYAETKNHIALDPLFLGQRAGLNGYFACCWKKNFSLTHPHSGFMQFFLGEWDGASEHELETFLKFSLSSWPLTASVTRYMLM